MYGLHILDMIYVKSGTVLSFPETGIEQEKFYFLSKQLVAGAYKIFDLVGARNRSFYPTLVLL